MAVLTRFDPFRDLERLSDTVFSRATAGGRIMPADAYRRDNDVYVVFDLPGIDPDAVDITVEKNVLSVTAERTSDHQDGDQQVLAERPHGRFTRRLYLSDNLGTNEIEASYDKGVLTVRIPVSEKAKPRRVQVTSGDAKPAIDSSSN